VLQNRFKFNLRFKSAGEFFARLCALLIYAAGARLLGADGFGLFSLAFSYAMIASVLIDSGTLNIVTRNLARDRSTAPELVRTLTTYKFSVAPLAVLAIYGLVRLIDAEGNTPSLVLATGLVAAGTAMGDHFSAILSGFERMDVEAGIKIVNRISALVFAIGLFYLHRTVAGFTLGMAIGVWISVGVAWWWTHRHIAPLSLTINGNVLREVLWTGLPLLAAWLFITLYANQDRYILSILDFSPHDIGVYSASAKLIDALRPIPVLLMGAVFPIVAEAAVRDQALYDKIAGTLVKYSVIGLFPFAFGVSVFSTEIVRIIFGPEFASTAGILSIAIWGFTGVFLNHLFLYLLVSSNQQKKFLQGAIILMVVNAPLCWILFQSNGLVGGAWALIGSEAALLIFNIAASPWARRQIVLLFGRPAALAASSLAVFAILRFWLPSAASYALSIAVYAVLVWRASLVDIALLRRFIV
jgi:O-antigen/teichoic acid export membrane protein